MNEWSSGQLWDNMMVVMGRKNLEEEQLTGLCRNGTNIDESIRNEKSFRVNKFNTQLNYIIFIAGQLVETRQIRKLDGADIGHKNYARSKQPTV